VKLTHDDGEPGGEVETDTLSHVKCLLVVCLQRVSVILHSSYTFFASNSAQQEFLGRRNGDLQLYLAYIVPNHV